MASHWRDGHVPGVYNIDIKPGAVINPYLPERRPPDTIVKEVVIARISRLLRHSHIVIPLEMDVVPQLYQRQAASRNILQKLQQKSETRGAVPFQLSAVSPPDFIVFA